MSFKDYYAILGISRDATEEEIKKAYRGLAMKYHPDKNPGDVHAEERFKRITEAHEVLSNPEKRRRYDSLGRDWNSFHSTGGGTYHEWYRQQARQKPGGKTRKGQTYYAYTATDEDTETNKDGGFSDFFEDFFGGGFKKTGERKSRRKGPDYETNLYITLEEALNGSVRMVRVDGKKLRVRIRPGSVSGQRLRLKNLGTAAPAGGEKGDLYFVIRIAKHPFFKQKGSDLIYTLDIDLYTALLGGQRSLRTLEGKPITVAVPPESDTGRILRIRGLGLPRTNGSEQRGDLLIRLSVHLPRNLSEQERALLRRLAELREPEMASMAGA